MYFSEPRAHPGSLFISSNILPLQILYAEKVSSIMFDVSFLNAPSYICDLFTKANSKHKNETRFSSSGNYYVKPSWIKIKVLFPVLELNFGTQFQTNFVNSPKDLFAKSVATTVVNAPKIDSSLVNFCKTIFVTVACFFFFCNSLFSA